MTFLTGKGIIDSALTMIRNNSNPVRVKLLTWLNITAQKLAVARPWLWLSDATVTLTPVNNVITLPVDYGQFQSIVAGSLLLTTSNRLTAGEAYHLDQTGNGLALPRGFTERPGTITLHGAGFSDPVTLTYTIEPSNINDNDVPTCWPIKCQPVLYRSLLDFFYEYDMDERAGMSYQLNAAELSELKKWDNSQKPKGQSNRHGYRRGR